MRSALNWISLSLILVLSFGVLENREVVGQEPGSPNGPYLLLDKGLQYRITKSINSMYNFDFATAERDFAVIMYQYPEHPLPDFLMALGYWWRIEIDVENKRYDNIFIQYLDRANDKAKKMLDQNPRNKEAAFFLAAGYGFQGRLYSERQSWTKATFAGKNALNYMNLSRGEEEFNPELLLGDALFNYFSVWIPENYPLLKPILALFPKGNKKLGLAQLEKVASTAFYTRVEAQYFLFRLYGSEEKRPQDALRIAEYLFEKFPNNPYFHRSYARYLYTTGKWTEAMQQSFKILEKIENKQLGYEANGGRFASFFLGEYFYRVGNKAEAKKYYQKTVAFGEESESQESGYYLYALISLGKIATAEKNKPQARIYFNAVKKYAKRKHPAHKEARDFVKKNKL
jgi:hypothetical protein